MAKTLATKNTKTTNKTLATKANTMRNTMNTMTATTRKTASPRFTKQIEKMYTAGMGARRIADKLNIPRHHVMRTIENLGLFTYAEGSYR